MNDRHDELVELGEVSEETKGAEDIGEENELPPLDKFA